VLAATAALSGGVERGKGAMARQTSQLSAVDPTGKDHNQPAAAPYLRREIRPLRDRSQGEDNNRPYAAPYYWAAFVLAGDPD
jgi:CHAT domain-containing protein